MHFLSNLSIPDLIAALGYPGLFLIVFAESGFFMAPLLPGDSLLFGAGILASQGLFNVWSLIIVFFVAAVTGNSFGYWFGRKFAKRIFDGTLPYLKPEHLKKAHAFYEKHGAQSITIARFVPIVRTFMPILAGAAEMNYRTFITYNVLGAILWSGGITILGYYLGTRVPDIEQYLIPGILIIIAASVAPFIKQYFTKKRSLNKHK
jgi:membrane-associated protein